MSKLVILTTWEDIDGFKVIRREDTHQVVRSRDISVIKSIDLSFPMLSNTPKGYVRVKNLNYFNLPDSVVPKDANAIAFLDFELENNNSVQGAWYCKLDENPNDRGIEVYTLMSKKIFG